MEFEWETMGMSAKLSVVGEKNTKPIMKKIQRQFAEIDAKFSTFKYESEVSRYNRGEIELNEHPELRMILDECDRTKRETKGYFDSQCGGTVDPSGLVKGYAISQAAKLLKAEGYNNFMMEIAGDVQTSGVTQEKTPWKIGIENPFDKREIVKVVHLSGEAIATSGIRVHKDHIINPFTKKAMHEIASMSVIAPDIFDADRMATAAFAMGTKGIEFIQSLPGYSGYMITNTKQGIMTDNFRHYA